VHAAMRLLFKELEEQLTNLIAGTDLHTLKSTIRRRLAALWVAFRLLSVRNPRSSVFTAFLHDSGDNDQVDRALSRSVPNYALNMRKINLPTMVAAPTRSSQPHPISSSIFR
jgi:hypothetical protein